MLLMIIKNTEINNNYGRCAKREAQAKIIQDVIEKYVSQDYEIMVIGDYTD